MGFIGLFNLFVKIYRVKVKTINNMPKEKKHFIYLIWFLQWLKPRNMYNKEKQSELLVSIYSKRRYKTLMAHIYISLTNDHVFFMTSNVASEHIVATFLLQICKLLPANKDNNI